MKNDGVQVYFQKKSQKKKTIEKEEDVWKYSNNEKW